MSFTETFQVMCKVAISTCKFVALLFNAISLMYDAILVDFQNFDICIVKIFVLYKVNCHSQQVSRFFPNIPVLLPFSVLTKNRELWKP